MKIGRNLPVHMNRRLAFTGIFLVSLSGLILEVSITRIFSAAIWYHYSFVAVSLALVGLGASGLAVQYGLKRINEDWAHNLTIGSAWLIVIMILITLYVMHALSSHIAYIQLFMFLFAMPFFFIGVVVSSAFNAFASVAGRLYAADLIGASIGALLVILFLTLNGGEGSALIVGTIGAISAIIFSVMAGSKKKIVISLTFLQHQYR